MIRDKQKSDVLAYLTLVAHAATHFLVALALLLILGFSAPIGMAMIIGTTHFFIDRGKIMGYYGVLTDQVLHWLVIVLIVLCKNLT